MVNFNGLRHNMAADLQDRMVLLEAQVKQLSEEKAELQAEKAELAGQNAVLTQVIFNCVDLPS